LGVRQGEEDIVCLWLPRDSQLIEADGQVIVDVNGLMPGSGLGRADRTILPESRHIGIRRTFSLCSTTTALVTETMTGRGAPRKIGASDAPKSLVRIRATHPVIVTGASPDQRGNCRRCPRFQANLRENPIQS
jgi:hypothetical protein